MRYRILQYVVVEYATADTASQAFSGNSREVGGCSVADIRSRFGARLRQLRTAKALSQEALAEHAGLHRTFVSMVERGKRNVTIATVEKLAKGLKCRMADLMPDAESGKAG